MTTRDEMVKKEYEICFVEGCEGPHIGLNDYRIAGPKAWGGGKIKHKWTITLDDLARAIPEIKSALEAADALLNAGEVFPPKKAHNYFEGDILLAEGTKNVPIVYWPLLKIEGYNLRADEDTAILAKKMDALLHNDFTPELVEELFPKGCCKERGAAIVLHAKMLIAITEYILKGAK